MTTRLITHALTTELVPDTTQLSSSYGRASRTVSARLTAQQLHRVTALAASRRCTVGELTRLAIVRLTEGAADSEVLAAVVKALGLSPDASTDAIVEAFSALINSIVGGDAAPPLDVGADGLQESADPKPAPKQLAASHGGKVITLADGRRVTISVSEVTNCETLGASLEAYAENKAIREAARQGAPTKRSSARNKFELDASGEVVMRKR